MDLSFIPGLVGHVIGLLTRQRTASRPPTRDELHALDDLFGYGVAMRNEGAYQMTTRRLPGWIKRVDLWAEEVYGYIADFAPAEAATFRTLNTRALPLDPRKLGRIVVISARHDLTLRCHNARVDQLEAILRANGITPR